MYNVKSNKAEEFIDDQEILETIAYAKENKDNRELIFSLIERAKDCKGLTHREAMLLLECEIPEAIDEMEKVAKMIKQKLYGNRIVMFAPLYLSNYCVNGCVYCPYHFKKISNHPASDGCIKHHQHIISSHLKFSNCTQNFLLGTSE